MSNWYTTERPLLGPFVANIPTHVRLFSDLFKIEIHPKKSPQKKSKTHYINYHSEKMHTSSLKFHHILSILTTPWCVCVWFNCFSSNRFDALRRCCCILNVCLKRHDVKIKRVIRLGEKTDRTILLMCVHIGRPNMFSSFIFIFYFGSCWWNEMT